MRTPLLNESILAAALEGLELQRTRIDAQIADVRALLATGSRKPVASTAVAGEETPGAL